MKYLWRAGLKGEEGISVRDKQIEDLKKARFYLDYEIARLENTKKASEPKEDFNPDRSDGNWYATKQYKGKDNEESH